MTSLRATLSKRAWKRRSRSCLARLTDLALRSALTEPLSPSRASMKHGPFAPGGLCCPADRHYYDPLRLPLGRPPLPGIAGYRRTSLPVTPQVTGPRRLSPVSRPTIHTFHAQYAGGFSASAPGSRTPSMAFAVGHTGSAPSLPAPGRDSLTTLAQASLALRTARLPPPRSAPGLSTTHGGIATRDPGVSLDRTHTGRPT